MEKRKADVYNKIRNEAKSRGNKVEFVSFTKLDKYLKCRLSYKYEYIDKIKTEFKDNLWGSVGTMCHDLIEKYYTENLHKKDLLLEFSDRSKKISKQYEVDTDISLLNSTKHFFEHSDFLHNLNNRCDKAEFEVPVYIQLKYNLNSGIEYWLVGFIDMIEHNKDGTINIIDFKTSNISGYSGKSLEKAIVQLYAYAYMYEAMYRKRISNVGYLFIKYVDIVFNDNKGKSRKSSKVERKDIYNEYDKKGGKDTLTFKDTITMFEFNKDNRLTHIKKLIDLFMSTKTDTTFLATHRDKGYCDRFCQFRVALEGQLPVCSWEDPAEEPSNIMMGIFSSACKGGL